MAACRLRQVEPQITRWVGKRPQLPDDDEELARHLLEIAEADDEGKPKSGRRYYYLALSHGHIKPDMGAGKEAADTRTAAYKKVLKVLGILRRQNRLALDMVLDLTRDIVQWRTYASPREARALEAGRQPRHGRWLGHHCCHGVGLG